MARERARPGCRTALDGGDDVLRSALLDLRALSVGLPVSVAGWSDRWRYAWPRDVSFVATALARTGHPDARGRAAAPSCRRCSARTAVFEARYDPSTRRTPDERVAQLDGSAWVVWGAHQLAAAAPDRAVELLDPAAADARAQREPADRRRSTPDDPPADGVVGLLGARRATSVTLGTAASVLAGLRSASRGAAPRRRVLPGRAGPLGGRVAAAAGAQALRRQRLPPAARRLRGGRRGDLPRRTDRPDAAATSRCSRAMDRAQTVDGAAGRRASPRACGWKNDGISWTPADGPVRSSLGGQRLPHEGRDPADAGSATIAPMPGSFPEKVLHDGRPAAVAPLAWTAALVVIARHELVPVVMGRVVAPAGRGSPGRGCRGARSGDGAGRRCHGIRGRADRHRRRAGAGVVRPRPRRPARARRDGRRGRGRIPHRARGAQPVVCRRRLADAVGRPSCRRPPRSLPRPAAGRGRPGAALGRLPRRGGRGLVRRPAGAARAGGHGIRWVRRERRPGCRDRGCDSSGSVGEKHSDAVPAAFSCPVVVVDGGVLPEPGPARTAAVAALDALVAEVVAAAPAADVVVAGVGDGNSPVRPRAVVASGPSFGEGLLTSGSTRQPGVIQLQDLTATALERGGAAGAAVSGRAVSVVPGPIRRRRRTNVSASASGSRRGRPPFAQ